jgi:MFS family permease
VISQVTSAFGATSIGLILAAVALMSVGTQCVLVLSQTRMLSFDATARSRLNTAFIVCNFVGGAIGAALASVLWQLGGWVAIMCGSIVILFVALAVWFVQRHRALAEHSPRAVRESEELAEQPLPEAP